jgi:hypothetical protein
MLVDVALGDFAARKLVGDREDNELSQVLPCLHNCIENQDVIFLTKMRALTGIHFHETFDAEVFEIYRFAFVKPFQGVGIEAMRHDRTRKIAHDLAVGFVIGQSWCLHVSYPLISANQLIGAPFGIFTSITAIYPAISTYLDEIIDIIRPKSLPGLDKLA